VNLDELELKKACDLVEAKLRKLGVLPVTITCEGGDDEEVSFHDADGRHRHATSLFNLIKSRK
jgi:hypothetical protein